ncbi:MAG TPA: hypothetical protein VMZ33_00375 [Candidatus Limnocylindrales bacterium]|nr:hypothetical protein [Candidatus Limnocylindrales bacterium]
MAYSTREPFGTSGFQGGFIEGVKRMGRPLVILSLALFAIACSVRPPVPPDFMVPIPAHGFGDFVVEVYDSAELLVDARARDVGPADVGAAGTLVSRPDRNELDVSWTGGACALRPLINVRGAPDNLVIELVPDPTDINLVVVPQECPAIGLPFGVTLTLSEPVEQANVTLTQPEQEDR